jgi:hypothetical protein
MVGQQEGFCELNLGNESQSAGRAHLIFLSASMLPEVQQSGLKALRSDDRPQQKKIKCSFSNSCTKRPSS